MNALYDLSTNSEYPSLLEESTGSSFGGSRWDSEEELLVLEVEVEMELELFDNETEELLLFLDRLTY